MAPRTQLLVLVGGCSLSESWACLNVFCSLSIASWPPTGILLGHLGPWPSLHSLTDPSSQKRRAALAPPFGTGSCFSSLPQHVWQNVLASTCVAGCPYPGPGGQLQIVLFWQRLGHPLAHFGFSIFLSLPVLGLARNGVTAAKAGECLSNSILNPFWNKVLYKQRAN